MPSIQELEQALLAADQAGDTAAAQAIADDIGRMSVSQPNHAGISDDFKKRSSISLARGENPILAGAADLAGGLSGITRGALNIAGKPFDEKFGDKLFPPDAVDKSSGLYTVGSLADPAGLYTGMKAYQVGKALPVGAKYLKNIVGGAAAGGAVGGLSEDTDIGTGAGIGAGISAALGPLGWAGKKTYETGRNLYAGKEGQAQKYLAEIFGSTPERAKVADELLKMKTGVTGERQTAGLASVTGEKPIPALKALEERARGTPTVAAEFAERDAANEAARARPLESIAAIGRKPPAEQGMPQRLSRAEATRQNITAPMYKEAGKDVVVVDDELQNVLGGAEVQSALNSAETSLKQAITNALVAGKKPPSGFTSGSTTRGHDLPEWSMDGPTTPDIVKPSTVTIDMLQRVKNNIDEEISSLTGTIDSAGKTKLSQLKVARAQLDKKMRESSTKWAGAQDTFKDLSEPQNQAQVAQKLLESLQSPAGVERAASLGQAWRNAPSTITNKAGVPRYQEMGQVFSPTQMRQAEGVVESVGREAKYASLPAKQTILPEVKNALDIVEKGTPGYLSVITTTFRKILSKAGGKLDNDSQAIIDRLMLEPEKLAAFMQKQTPVERDVIEKYLTNANNLVGRGKVIGSIVSAQQGE